MMSKRNETDLIPNSAFVGSVPRHRALASVALLVLAVCAQASDQGAPASAPSTEAAPPAPSQAAPVSPVPAGPAETVPAASQAAPGAEWGIKVEALRLSAAGYMLDLRYRVTDYAKATRFFNHKTAPHLLDPATGAILFIPSNAKLGKMRQVPIENDSGRVYFVLFANPGRYIKPGTRLSLVQGDEKLEGLVVDGGGTEVK